MVQPLSAWQRLLGDCVGTRTESYQAAINTGCFMAGVAMNLHFPDKEKPGERRRDGPTDAIDEGVVLASVDGVGPALEYMSRHGVPHSTAIRVLTGPQYHRRPRTQVVNHVLELIASKMDFRK